MKDFFISYNQADKTWAEWIAWHLEEAGHTTVLQAWDFRPGSSFVHDMQKAASEAERTIAVFSPDYLTSKFTQSEWEQAFARDPTGEKGLLLPVRVRKCEPKGLLRTIVYIDLVGKKENEAKQTLFDGIETERVKPETERVKPETEPPFPPGDRSVSVKPDFPEIKIPAIWNIPHLQNPHFTGRESLLTSLREGLASGKPTAVTQAISGLGGVGKTQLSLEYAYRHMEQYDVVWWIRSENSETLAGDYAQLANKLGLPEAEQTEQRITVAAVREWLEHNPKWLLIFDNAEDPSGLQDYLPRLRSGHTLITSRSRDWRNVATALEIKVLEPEEAIDFLLKKTGQTDSSSAAALAETTGCLPLALEQSGDYIDETGISLADYLALFTQHRKDLWQQTEPPDDYHATVATTWNLSFKKIEQASPGSIEILNLCAFLAPDNIPKSLLTEGTEHIPSPLAEVLADSLEFNKAIKFLRQYSLLEVTGELLSLHRLVQTVIRDRLSEQEQATWAKAAVTLVEEAFPDESDDVRNWPECVRLISHALITANHAETLGIAPAVTSDLLDKSGKYLLAKAEYSEAKTLFERALRIAEVEYGSNHPTVANRLNNLGFLLNVMADFRGAKEYYEHELLIYEKEYSPHHPEVDVCLNNLGRVLQQMGDLQGEKEHFERALRIDENAYGPDNLKVAIRVNNLGGVLEKMGDFQGVKEHYERALIIGEKEYGPNHPQVAIYLNNLGSVLSKMGDFQGAKEYFERALKIDEKAYGPNHPNVAFDLNNLGLVLKEMGELQGAKENIGRALEIFRLFLGEDHPSTVKVRENLAGLK